MLNIANAQYVNFKAAPAAEKTQKAEEINDNKEQQTESKNYKNLSIAGIALAAIILGGILIQKHSLPKTNEKINPELEKMKKEAEEKLKKEIDEIKKQAEEEYKIHQENLKREREFTERFNREFEEMLNQTNTQHSYYDWDSEFKKSQEEFDRWYADFNKKNEEFWKDYWEKDAEYWRKNDEFWKQFNDYSNNFKKEQEQANRAYKKSTTSQGSAQAHSASSGASAGKTKDTLTDADIKEIDELFKTNINNQALEKNMDIISLLLKASPEDIRKIKNKDRVTYRQYVLKLHPDKNPDDKLATFRFVILDKLFKS